jgi:hypothetical protein
MSEPLQIRKEIIIKDDGRKVIFYTFERPTEKSDASPHQSNPDKSTQETKSQ